MVSEPASRLFSPDSPIPNRRDIKDLQGMLRWFIGRGPKPIFERWAYWEKLDVWGACADNILIGSTGMILWFPTHFCAVLPGQTLNVAHLIHGKLALLATGFVFAIHFFNRGSFFPLVLGGTLGLVIGLGLLVGIVWGLFVWEVDQSTATGCHIDRDDWPAVCLRDCILDHRGEWL
jgi:hypothetical protein